MTDEQIEEELEKLDLMMIEALDDSNNLKKDADFLKIANQIAYLQNNITVRNRQNERFIMTCNAFFFAKNRMSVHAKEIIDAQKYYKWVKDEKEIEEMMYRKETISTEKAMELSKSAIDTGHELDSNIKSIIEKQYQRENSKLPRKITVFDKIRAKISSIKNKIFGKKKENKSQKQPIVNEEKIDYVPKTREEFKKKYRVENTNMVEKENEQKVIGDKLIVISDLHGNLNKWKYVTKAMNENPRIKLIIEGDAMDRGAYGLEILMQIRELCAEGKAIYLPGNHDVFAYDCLKTMGTMYEKTQTANRAKIMWNMNGGGVTRDKFDNFENIMKDQVRSGILKQEVSKEQLIDWLGNCPIQIKVQNEDMKYALSHAMFDEELFNMDPNFNLEKALRMKLSDRPNKRILNKFENCMWYRENDRNTHYADLVWPEGEIVIVGHTRQPNVNLGNINGDPAKPIVYLDCGKGSLQGYNITENKHIQIEPETYR